MQSVFLRIYLGMIVAMVAAAFIAAVATYYTNEYRIRAHITKYYSGTFRLIGEGISRHDGANQVKWLGAIEKLSGLYFEHQSPSESGLSPSQLEQLAENGFNIVMDYSLTKGQAYIQLPDSDEFLTVRLNDFGTSLVRLSAFLVLNELGRHKNTDRVTALNHLRGMFQYPIKLKSIDKVELSASHLRLVRKGNITVVLKDTTSSSPSLTAYAPLGNSPYVLALGSIPLFNWFPLVLIVVVVILLLLFMATATFLFVHPIERRLKRIDVQIEQIGKDQDISIAPSEQGDAIGRLDDTVNEMASRIHRLIDAQTDMVRAISHELRTPITRIRFRMSNIEDLELADALDDTNGVERDLMELENLIDEVLTFSRLRREKPLISLEPIMLDTFFKDIKNAVSPLAESIDVKFTGKSDVKFNGDRRFLTRAIENLVLNALRYAESKVEVRYVTSDNYQHIYVSDDGPGIPVNERKSIFEPFKRLDASRCRSSGGYGLGLAIVRQIAMWHQGNAQVRESQWGGADMVFSWPLALTQVKAS